MDRTTILVIDDDPSNIQTVIKLLQNSGFNYNVISASDSKLGVEIAIKALPDIIITDWQMPGLTGIEVINILSKTEATKEIPVIIATGINMTSSDLKYALDSGAFDFIRKPMDINELIARINAALKLVTYFRNITESEKLISDIKTESARFEIEAKKHEIIELSLMMIKMTEKTQQLNTYLETVDRKNCKTDCKVFSTANSYVKNVFMKSSEQIWNELEVNFEQVNENFYKNLLTKYPLITQNERKLCSYLRLNLSTKDISSISKQSARSIEIARTRLREKLGLKGDDSDLYSFLLSF